MKTCINNCTIKGRETTLTLMNKLLENNFSMQSLRPVGLDVEDIRIERALNWGCEEDMELINHIYCNFEPQTIDLTYNTDMPNLKFLKDISEEYDLIITNAYYDETIGYVGYIKIVNGEEVEEKYEESENYLSFLDLAKSLKFVPEEDIEYCETQNIISMRDILDIIGGKE